MRLINEAGEALGQPVIAARLAGLRLHALLNDRPAPVVRDDEAVEIQGIAILNCGAVDLGNEPARVSQGNAIEAISVAEGDELARGCTRVPAAAAADVNAELVLERCKAALQSADDAGGDAG